MEITHILMTITQANGSSDRPQEFGLKIHNTILQSQPTLLLKKKKKNLDFSTIKKNQF